MKQSNNSTHKRVTKIVVIIVIVTTIMFSLHMLVNYTDFVPLLRGLHGG